MDGTISQFGLAGQVNYFKIPRIYSPTSLFAVSVSISVYDDANKWV